MSAWVYASGNRCYVRAGGQSCRQPATWWRGPNNHSYDDDGKEIFFMCDEHYKQLILNTQLVSEDYNK